MWVIMCRFSIVVHHNRPFHNLMTPFQHRTIAFTEQMVAFGFSINNVYLSLVNVLGWVQAHSLT